MKKLKKENPDWNEQQIKEKIHKNLKQQNIKIKLSELDDVYDGEYDESNIIAITESTDFNEAKLKMKKLKQPEMRDMHKEYMRDYEETKGILLLDVTPLSLGIENGNGKIVKLIERNSVIPTKKTKAFLCKEMKLNEDKNIIIKLFQGEITDDLDKNILIESYTSSITLLKDDKDDKDDKAGDCVIEITIEIDVNGIIYLFENGNKIMIIEQDKSRPSQEKIDSMLSEAEKYGAVGGTSQKNELMEIGIDLGTVGSIMSRAKKEEL